MRQLWIGGQWVAPKLGRTRKIVNPATLEIVDEVAEGSAEDVRRACEVARAAQRHWGKLPALERGRLLHETALIMRNERAELSELLTREGGKPRIENLDEVEWSAACFDYYAEVARASYGNSVPPTAEHQLNFTIKEPLGVVGAIVPFNYPLLLLVWKIAPSLAAGNAVVIKPSELTPLATLRLCERALGHLPRGVVNVVTGTGPEVGEPLVDDPDVACVAFTGSTATGTRIAERAGRQLRRVNLEMGGIDPLIVFPDADLEAAIHGAAFARFLNSGQVCTSAKRIYLCAEIADRFLEGFVAHVRSLTQGDPMDPSSDLGPMISEQARDKVEAQVKRALEQGGKLLCGGGRNPSAGKGWYLEPTIVTGVAPGSILHQEEVFGPVAAIQIVKDPDEAIARAADTEYGLGANIFTKNLTWAMQAMQAIPAGSFWINDPLTDNDAAPFGGMRKSGMGRELGEEGLDAFRDVKHVHMDFVPEKKGFWFPYRRRAGEIPK